MHSSSVPVTTTNAVPTVLSQLRNPVYALRSMASWVGIDVGDTVGDAVGDEDGDAVGDALG